MTANQKMGSMGESEVANHPYHKFLVSAEGGSAVGVGVYYFEIKDGLDAPDCRGNPKQTVQPPPFFFKSFFFPT